MRSHLVIAASAGSGKTYRLLLRYLELLLDEARPAGILATTFTRKAAGEILERILGELSDVAEKETKRDELSTSLGRALGRERMLALLEKLVHNVHRLQIGTLDAFFARAAGSFALDLGLPPGWRIGEESEEALLRQDAVGALLAEAEPKELLSLAHLLFKGEAQRSVHREIVDLVTELHDLWLEAPREAWFAVSAPARVPATELEAARRVVESYPSGHKTLTKALADIRERARTGDWRKLVTIGLVKKIASGGTTFSQQELDPGLLEAVATLSRHATASIISDLVDQTRGTFDLLERYDRCLHRIRRERRLLRFDDITRALGGGVSLESDGRATGEAALDPLELAYRLDARVDHLLLDEFQDTSKAQWSVLAPLAEEILAHGDGSRTLFAVGDVKQSIYGWRGGEPEILLGLERLEGVDSEQLDVSYRSAPPVIETVNRVFEDLDQNEGFRSRHFAGARDWQRGFHRHSTKHDHYPGQCRLVVATGDEGVDRPTEVLVAEEIAAAPDLDFDIGILVRRNQTVERIVKELRRRGLEASEEGGVSIAGSPLVAAVLALVRLADHPADALAAFHVAHSPLGPLVGLEPGGGSVAGDSVELASSDAPADDGPSGDGPSGDGPPGEGAPINGPLIDGAERSRLSSRLRRDFLEDGYGLTIQRLVRRLAPAADPRSLEHLGRLVELAYRYEDLATLRPGDFVEHVERVKVDDPRAARIRVMTVHQSKGLQFDRVYLPELEGHLVKPQAKIFADQPEALAPPTRILRGVNENLALHRPELEPFLDTLHRKNLRDSLSLLYVGMTRAVHELTMVLPPPGRAGYRISTPASLLHKALAPRQQDDEAPSSERLGWPEAEVSGEVLFSFGEADWRERRRAQRERENPRQKAPKAVREPARLRFAPRTRRSRPEGRPPSLERRAASELGARPRSPAQRFRPTPAAERERGSLIHRLLEGIGWMDEIELTEEAGLALLGPTAPGGVDPRRVWSELRELLESEALRAVFGRSVWAARWGVPADRLEVECEQGFALLEGSELVTGAIDRLVVARGEKGQVSHAAVIDFKSDAFDEGEDRAAWIAAAVDRHRAQVELYRQAAGRLTGIEVDQVEAELVFLAIGERVAVERERA